MSEVQQSLFDEAQRMEEEQRRTRIRQQAFRVTYDFLEKHDPPMNTEEYWKQTCLDIGIAAATNGNNELCQVLLSAVLEYLSEKIKEKQP